jgi:hypothetical protein
LAVLPSLNLARRSTFCECLTGREVSTFIKIAIASEDEARIAAAEATFVAADAAAEIAFQAAIDAGDAAFQPVPSEDEWDMPPCHPLKVRDLMLVDDLGEPVAAHTNALYHPELLRAVHEQELEAQEWREFLAHVEARRESRRKSGAPGAQE